MNTSPSRRHLAHPKQIQHSTHRSPSEYGYQPPPPPPDRSPIEPRMAVTDGWHHHRVDQHRAGPHHGYASSEWAAHPSHHHPHYLPPPDQQSGAWRNGPRIPEHHPHEAPYLHHQHPQHHGLAPAHHRPTASPPQHRGHAKSSSRDNFLPPPLPPTMGPPSDRGSPSSVYEAVHPAKARSANPSRQPSPPRNARFDHGEWGHKRKRSEGHDQYGPIERSAWGPYPNQPQPHNGTHYHPDAPPSWGQPPPFYEADYGRMQPPAPKKVSGHDRNRSIDDPRMARKTTQPPPSPGHRNGILPVGSPYDQPPRLPRAATEEVRHHPHQLGAGPAPRLTPPESLDAAGYYPGGPAHLPTQQHHAASQPLPAPHYPVKDESAKQRAADARRQKEAAKQSERAMQREHERQQREQREQQAYEAEVRRASAMPPVRSQPSPPPMVHHAGPMHYESAPPLPLPSAPQAYHGAPHPPQMEYGAPPQHHQPRQPAVAEQPFHRGDVVHPAKDAYFDPPQQRAVPAVPATAQPTVPLHQLPVTRARIISDPVWQWFDDSASASQESASAGNKPDARQINAHVGTWTYASHRQPLLPGDLLARNIGGLVEVRIRGQDLGAYREISDTRAQLGWTLGWRARHHGIRVDMSDRPISKEAAAKLKADAETRLSLTRRKLWGSEVYTDDSDVLAMCIHSGWIEYPSAASGEARKEHDDIQMYSPSDVKVTLRIAPRLVDYAESFGGGLWSRSWHGRHDGVSLFVESVELQKSGFAASLPGHRGTKLRVAEVARMRARFTALSQLDQLAAKATSSKSGQQFTAPTASIAALENRKQSVFPLSDVRKHSDTPATASKQTLQDSTGAPSFWWQSLFIDRQPEVVTQKA